MLWIINDNVAIVPDKNGDFALRFFLSILSDPKALATLEGT